MIDDVLKSIRRVIESESNEKLDKDFYSNIVHNEGDLKETKTEESFPTVTENVSYFSTESIKITSISNNESTVTTLKSTSTAKFL